VRVSDDGVGMSRDDGLLCLERHATSKIRRAEDLAAIATMGFRGEALPSIASVSRFTLTTRERGSSSPEGTRIVIAGGKMNEVKAAGCAEGTSVEVRQLFFNLPARRKFLRTEETESAHIQHYLTLAAMACPQVAFTFQKDGRIVWQLAAVKTGPDSASRLAALRERMRALSGSDQKLLPVDFSAELQPPRSDRADEEADAEAGTSSIVERLGVWGFIGAPGVSRATREDQHLFVNRRPVENRGLNFALLEGYHTALMKGRYPVCCLFLELDPGAVDVNIHPAKREVKFHRESEVRRLVARAVQQTLLSFHSTSPGATPKPAAAAHVSQQQPLAQPTTIQPAFPSLAPTGPGVPAPAPRTVPGAAPSSPARALAVSPALYHHAPAPVPAAPALPAQPPASPTPSHRQDPVPLLRVPLRLVGVIGRLYVVLESDRGLVLLDQHAAHERVLFEQMLDRLERGDQAPSQRLLLPETVEVSVRDAVFLREQLPALTRLGVGLSEFGERTFLLDALPPFVKVSDSRRFVLQLVDELKAAGQEVNSSRLGEQTVAKTVCRHAVKANDPLAGRELENLVEDLRRCAMPYTCPHGRPTLIEMNFRELERKFGRSQ
jgi:DNA mismatch repair protein MutL